MENHVILLMEEGLQREGLKLLLEKMPEYKVTAPRMNGKMFRDYLAEYDSDVVITDTDTFINYDDFKKQENNKNRDCSNVLVLMSGLDKMIIRQLLSCGVKGLLLPGSGKNELREAVQAVIRERFYISQKISGKITVDYVELITGMYINTEIRLSKRETAVLKSVAEGHTTKEIAADLNLSERTVDVYKFNIRNKLNVFSDAGLTRYAIKHGMITC